MIETGVFGAGDMIPLPCNPESISIGYGLRNGEMVGAGGVALVWAAIRGRRA